MGFLGFFGIFKNVKTVFFKKKSCYGPSSEDLITPEGIKKLKKLDFWGKTVKKTKISENCNETPQEKVCTCLLGYGIQCRLSGSKSSKKGQNYKN